MARYAILRDDDINFFTSPKMLERVYEEIFEIGIPVNFSVIPCVKTDIRIKDNQYSRFGGLMYEPFLPKEFRGKTSYFAVDGNDELIDFMKNVGKFTEVVQHGFSHSPNEFFAINIDKLKTKIINGSRILNRAFGVRPKFFSAPYDGYSPVALTLVKRFFWGATYGEFTLRNMLSLRYGARLPPNMISHYLGALKRKVGFFVNDGFMLVGNSGISLSDPFVNAGELVHYIKSCTENRNLIVIQQHYWEYFYKKSHGCIGNTVNKKQFDMYIGIIQSIKNQGFKFITFTQFYKKVCA